MEITCHLEPGLSAAEFIDVLRSSGLAERRPVDDASCIETMLRPANIVVAARSNGKLVGVSRALTDNAYCTYLSDLTVAAAYQSNGISRQQIRRTHEAAGMQTTLILLAAPQAGSYYPHIRMEAHPSCWVSKPKTRS